jgi:hypothetical protein
MAFSNFEHVVTMKEVYNEQRKWQVMSEDGKGEMSEARDSASHAIVVDVLMGIWGTYKEQEN